MGNDIDYSINYIRTTGKLSLNEIISIYHTLYQDELQMDQGFKCKKMKTKKN